ARGIAGFFPAAAVGDDIEIYTDESRSDVRAQVYTLRQQVERRAGVPNRALADYVAPKETGLADYIGAFAVTAGIGVYDKIAEFKADHDDYNAIMVEAMADRLAEAFAEFLHAQVRRELWGFGANENLDNDALIAEKYQGIRP